MIKQVIIIPTYLGMKPGKVASQACHAAIAGHKEAWNHAFQVEKRIILKADTTDQINALWKQAGKDENLLRIKIVDEGRTEVRPYSVTAISFIGQEKDVDKITGSLPLL